MQTTRKTRRFKVPVYWILFFVITIVILNAIALHYSEPREILISDTQASQIGEKLLINETYGKNKNLVQWNENEKVVTLGIGHFKWFTADKKYDTDENFLKLLEYISQSRKLPNWLVKEVSSPSRSNQNFSIEEDEAFLNQLNFFLLDTLKQQSQFLIQNLELSLPISLKAIRNPFAREKIRENFYQIANYDNGTYALIDYDIFVKHYKAHFNLTDKTHFDLIYILNYMKGNSENPVQEFANSSNFLLMQHLENAPNDRAIWISSWQHRVNTYTMPNE